MNLNRRQFLKGAAAAGAFVSVGGLNIFLPKRAFAFQQSPSLTKFAVPLTGLGVSGSATPKPYIPVILPDTTTFPGCDFYKIVARNFTQQILPAPAGPTTFWGYAADVAGPDSQYLGGVIVATRNRPVRLLVKNKLPATHFLPVDISSFFPDAVTPQNKIAVHLHGGLVPWISDGGPFAWFTPAGGPVGPDYLISRVPDMTTPLGSLSYYYPVDQSARLVWYHDHAHDLTRLNAYAGIASAFLITDQFESSLISQGILPDLGFPYTLGVPLIIQDKGFNADGTLFYPSVYESNGTGQSEPSMVYSEVATCTGLPNDPPTCGTGRYAYGPTENPPAQGVLTPLPNPSVVPEAFFDTILVNGAPYPVFPVAPRRYRFRMLNGSQARFYNLQLYVSDGTLDGITLKSTGVNDPNGNPILIPDPATNPAGPAFIQIGTEGGFLPAPVAFGDVNTNKNSNATIDWDALGNVNKYNLLLGTAERADVIIDFRGFEGQDLILYSDTPAPFPGGDIRNDYYPGAPDLRGIGGANTPAPGKSPDTRILMKFTVGTTGGITEKTLAQTYSDLQGSSGLPYVFAQSQPAPLAEGSANKVRNLSLNEDFDKWGRLIQRLGTDQQNGLNNQGQATWGLFLDDAPTEITNVGDVEVWNIFNFTGDTHPIHFHLVNVQILGRAQISGTPGDFNILGNFGPADANERGWKETVRMNPFEVTKVIMKFDLPKVPFPVPDSVRTFPVVGSEYVWHCHILEHEEHDMMRPLIVQGPYPLAVVPESQSAAKKSTATFQIVNGTPPYTITVADKQDAKKFPPVPATVGSNGGTFTVDLKKGTSPDHEVIYTIKDNAGKIVTATLTITKK